ncbi:MAG: hypothetical protein EOP33_03610 [Rickettsiaceae bacterium]|nr:MAG: hypothetical protein EOP33_03610 [Rickettsiaceae bacterium]
MTNLKIHEVISLNSSRESLKQSNEKVNITNIKGSTRYLGIRVLDYIFKQLQHEFTHVENVILNVDDDHAALFTAVNLGYKNINYTGGSQEVVRMLKHIKGGN